ncbi:response regulator [Streptomyces tsukubensis]|uniref:Response regulator n=1 Tax=Streptomyces tsukubensis TaxID=83656 RepID=A0A1V4AG92_9ACTN|nr:response regulator [Streptomyces tsukubensis]QFR97441.1 response regulator [Streptomyces tsukubensis]
MQRALERRARQEAAGAARAGATYPQLGEAWNMSRQGARRRWPGLAFAPSPAPTPDSRSAAMNVLQRPYDVLLVEDDAADALLIEDALHEHGAARVITRVSDGLDALTYLRDPATERPDLIVLDLNMPRMNGRELLAVLKSDDDLALIPVVILTTSAAPDDVQGAYRGHANAYVTKPVNLDQFIGAVRSIDAFFLETSVGPPRQ